jgi:hypothetical protein
VPLSRSGKIDINVTERPTEHARMNEWRIIREPIKIVYFPRGDCDFSLRAVSGYRPFWPEVEKYWE